MASKPLRDWVYLSIIATQLFGMLTLDLVPLYPNLLWKPPHAPLHFLLGLRDFYVSFSGDPFFAPNQPYRPFFEIFLYIEGLVQLPLAAFLVRRLSKSGVTSGPTELAGLAFGCLTSMGSAACVFELLHMGPDMLSEEKRVSLVYGTYLPFLVIPFMLAVDMYMRLLPRVRESKPKTA